MPYYLSENGVCKEMIRLAQYDFENLNIDVDHEIKLIEREEGIKLAQNQVMAVKEAIEKGVVIITGGPGTGKQQQLIQLSKYLKITTKSRFSSANRTCSKENE